jgi:hypothetical protein
VEVVSTYKGAMAEYWDDPVPVMTKRLLATLQAAGVANLDTYQAVIFDPNQNVTYDDYVAFNLVGAVSPDDAKAARIDPAAELMFRYDSSSIVVHEKVKAHLEASGIDTLEYYPLRPR